MAPAVSSERSLDVGAAPQCGPLSPLRRNAEHSPNQPLSATLDIPARSSVDLDQHSNVVWVFLQQNLQNPDLAGQSAFES